MAYNGFTLEAPKQHFGLQTEEARDEFSKIEPVPISETLRRHLNNYVPCTTAIGTEKARSELIITPVLLEVIDQCQQQISFFSGVEFNVDPDRGLRGVCDYLFSLSPEQFAVQAPVVTVVEARNENIRLGVNQCIAEMVAAQTFNRAKGNPIETVYGTVTTGSTWLFMRLTETTVSIDPTEYYIREVERIVTILLSMLRGTGAQAYPPVTSSARPHPTPRRVGGMIAENAGPLRKERAGGECRASRRRRRTGRQGRLRSRPHRDHSHQRSDIEGSMKTEAQRRKRDAGFMLVDACEQALGVRGPTALAALTGRSKAWWSKLASGTAAFPSWEELVRLLPAGLTDVEREQLHLGYRKAWLWLYDPVLLHRLDGPVPPDTSLAALHALQTAAGVFAHNRGDHRIALQLMNLLELLLVPRGIAALSPGELSLLRECLTLQSICVRELGDYEAAIAVALRSVRYQQTGHSQSGTALARHELGLAQQGAGIHADAGLLSRSLKTFHEVQREFERLDMPSHAIAARRDSGATQLFMERLEEGEGELIRAYEVPQQTAESQFPTVLWLVDASVRRCNIEQARRWLAKTRVIARRHPDEIAALMSVWYIAQTVTLMERAVADRLPTRSR